MHESGGFGRWCGREIGTVLAIWFNVYGIEMRFLIFGFSGKKMTRKWSGPMFMG
jgi:hypothetical protein